MKDAPKLLNIPKSEECPDDWIRLPKHKWQKSWNKIIDPVGPLERNFYRHPLAGLLLERQFEEVLLELGWEKVPNWECLFLHRKQHFSLPVYVDDIKKAGKKQNMPLMWKKLMKKRRTRWTNIISWPRTFGMHSTWMQTKWNHSWERKRNVWITYFWWRNWRITRMEKTCPTTWKGMLKNAWNEIANWRTKKTEQLYKVSTLCQIRKEELESVGELSEVCSQIVLNYLYLARIGRLDIPWSVNKFARSVTKWTQAFDRRWARLTSKIHHTSDYRQLCHVGNTAQHCRLGSFQDSDFAGDLEDSKSTSGGVLCIFGCCTFVPISWMCQKANFSITQFNRIWNCIFGCWFANGWFTCSWPVGSCNWGTAFDTR